jgi:nitrate/nitrite-specific signal transduction histidine kinase
MNLFNSILAKLFVLVAIVEFFIMLLYEFFPPLSALTERYVLAGPILDTVTLILIITFAYIRMLKRPMDKLLQVMRRVEGMDFSASADSARRDEFGLIASCFNSVSQRLKNWGNELGAGVEERTQELNAANEKMAAFNRNLVMVNEDLKDKTSKLQKMNDEFLMLRGELEHRVEERTEEMRKTNAMLEKKVRDMEVFYKVAIDRELKMREMKETIRKMEEKLR